MQNNVLCGSEQEAEPYLAEAALDDEVRRMEQGLETVIGPGGTRLSGGSGAAAGAGHGRWLILRPVLVLDDPSPR